MPVLRTPRPGDLPGLKALWQTAFADGADLLGDFFRRCPLDRVLALWEREVPAAMLCLLPMEAAGAPLPYVYALCTRPAARGRGYARQLLDHAARLAEGAGAAGLSTVPAQPSLHRFFAAAGYREAFSTQIWRPRGADLPRPGPSEGLTAVTPGAYNALRTQQLRGLPHEVWPEEWVAFQAGVSRRSGAGLYQVTAGGAAGCAAVELGAGQVTVKELLITSAALPAAAGVLAAAFPARGYELRFPSHPNAPGQAVPFGMVRPLGAWTPPRGAYLGLAFD